MYQNVPYPPIETVIVIVNSHLDILDLLGHYDLGTSIQHVESLGAAGGFSGAEFWQVQTVGSRWCLRKWPTAHPTQDRLQWMHAVLQYAWKEGFKRLPLPLVSRQGTTFVENHGCFWELTPWLNGTVVNRFPAASGEITAAMETLAHFHEAVASFPGTPQVAQPSPGLVNRVQLLRKMNESGLDDITSRLSSHSYREIVERAKLILEISRPRVLPILSQLERLTRVDLAWQACIRDIHRQHVLFDGLQVSGLIDFGAMNYDTVATDVARLLGSLARNDLQVREEGLRAYTAVRPLNTVELELVECFDQANVILSPLNWLQWLLIDGRQFADLSLVWQRLDELIERFSSH